MNIRNRIKKMEQSAGINKSNYCACYGTNLKYEVIPITIPEWKRRVDAGEPTEERLPDFCNRCKSLLTSGLLKEVLSSILKSFNGGETM